METHKTAWGILLAFLGGCFWGLSGSCGSYLFTNYQMEADFLVPVRLMTAGIIMMVIQIVRNRKLITAPWKTRENAIALILFTLFGMAACQYTYFKTIQLSNAAVATVLQYIGPAFVLIYTCIRMKKKPLGYEVIALICSLGGVFLMATHGKIGSLAISPAALIIGLISAVTLLIYTVQPGKLLAQFGTPLILAWSMFLGGIIMIGLLRPWNIAVALDGKGLLALAVIIVFGTIISFSAYLKATQLIGPAWASMVACVEPLAAMVISVVWLKIRVYPLDILGMLLVMATPVILGYFGKKST